jgi:hypothetical protein
MQDYYSDLVMVQERAENQALYDADVLRRSVNNAAAPEHLTKMLEAANDCTSVQRNCSRFIGNLRDFGF